MNDDTVVNYGITITLSIVVIAILIFSLSYGEPNYDRNAVDQRNHKRDRIECESAGGFLGEGGYSRKGTVYSVCHDVDSLIVLNGAREFYNE